MKWIEALKKWNDDKPAWCIPRKGTDEYTQVKNIMSGKQNKTKKDKINKVEDFEVPHIKENRTVDINLYDKFIRHIKRLKSMDIMNKENPTKKEITEVVDILNDLNEIFADEYNGFKISSVKKEIDTYLNKYNSLNIIKRKIKPFVEKYNLNKEDEKFTIENIPKGLDKRQLNTLLRNVEKLHDLKKARGTYVDKSIINQQRNQIETVKKKLMLIKDVAERQKLTERINEYIK